MATRAGCREYPLAESDRAVAELGIERGVESLRVWQAARLPKVGWSRREQEGDDVVESILNRPKACAVAPALSDVERRLAIIALRRVDARKSGTWLIQHCSEHEPILK